MKIALFTIPIHESGSELEALNRFLRSKKILQVNQELVKLEHTAFWTFAIQYLDDKTIEPLPIKNKKDYKSILSPEVFSKFSELRVIRKTIAIEEGVPAYAVFTDEELSKLASLTNPNLKQLSSIEGIGEQKVKKYGERFLQTLNTDFETGELFIE